MTVGGAFWRRGAFAALMREARSYPLEPVTGTVALTSSLGQVIDIWYQGFDAARARLAALEAEMIRGKAGTGAWKMGAYAALTARPRYFPETMGSSDKTVGEWYAGFDAVRARLADLEAEMIRGEEPK